MFSKTSKFSLSCLSLLALSACTGHSIIDKPNMEKAEYWQRQSVSSSIYLQGPKAQQMLHQNIASCTAEIRELQNLGEIRRVMPANYNSGNDISDRTAAQKRLDQWDTPERDGYLLNEHMDYHDFETCMVYKGWERAEYLPYTDAEKAREDYLKPFNKRDYSGNYENVVTEHPRIQNPPPYENLNQ